MLSCAELHQTRGHPTARCEHSGYGLSGLGPITDDDLCRLFGFLLGSTLAGASVYYYILEEYKVSNELLTEDIYVCRHQTVPQTSRTLCYAPLVLEQGNILE